MNVATIGSSPHTWGILCHGLCLDICNRVHPHIRGAYTATEVLAEHVYGSSPHTWGIPFPFVFLLFSYRFIPTYVGHTSGRAESPANGPVHPHIRGAYDSSPGPFHTYHRFIPTYVGHTSRKCGRSQRPAVHPHIRGAYTERQARLHAANGSSPHTWGIPSVSHDFRSVVRFIPTYVGHTRCCRRCIRRRSVHPHIRGAYSSMSPPR